MVVSNGNISKVKLSKYSLKVCFLCESTYILLSYLTNDEIYLTGIVYVFLIYFIMSSKVYLNIICLFIKILIPISPVQFMIYDLILFEIIVHFGCLIIVYIIFNCLYLISKLIS